MKVSKVNNLSFKKVSAGLMVAVILTGCAGAPQNSSEREIALMKERDALKTLAKENQMTKDAAIERAQLAESRLDNIRPVVANQTTGSLLPPNAEAGHCYSRVYVEPKYQNTSKQVLVREASANISIIPAKYTWEEQSVLVREPHKHLKIIPGTYKWVEEKVLVEPEQTVLVEVPAKYETVTEKVLDKPAHTIWKKGTGPIQKIDAATGEIMCLVDIPASYKTVSRTELRSPATVKKKVIPAVYKTVKRKVVDVPERTVEIVDPAEYKTVKVRKLVTEAKSVSNPIPAEYSQVTQRNMVADGFLEWREILCETNTDADVIRRLQSRLKDQGYNPGPIDGNVGTQTIKALNKYQADNKLPMDQYLNVKSLKKLGVI